MPGSTGPNVRDGWMQLMPETPCKPVAGLFVLAWLVWPWLVGHRCLRDWLGECDMRGKVLEITAEVMVDEVAATANRLRRAAAFVVCYFYGIIPPEKVSMPNSPLRR